MAVNMQDVTLVHGLLAEGQEHLLEHWPPVGQKDEKNRQIMRQARHGPPATPSASPTAPWRPVLLTMAACSDTRAQGNLALMSCKARSRARESGPVQFRIATECGGANRTATVHRAGLCAEYLGKATRPYDLKFKLCVPATPRSCSN